MSKQQTIGVYRLCRCGRPAAFFLRTLTEVPQGYNRSAHMRESVVPKCDRCAEKLVPDITADLKTSFPTAEAEVEVPE